MRRWRWRRVSVIQYQCVWILEMEVVAVRTYERMEYPLIGVTTHVCQDRSTQYHLRGIRPFCLSILHPFNPPSPHLPLPPHLLHPPHLLLHPPPPPPPPLLVPLLFLAAIIFLLKCPLQNPSKNQQFIVSISQKLYVRKRVRSDHFQAAAMH